MLSRAVTLGFRALRPAILKSRHGWIRASSLPVPRACIGARYISATTVPRFVSHEDPKDVDSPDDAAPGETDPAATPDNEIEVSEEAKEEAEVKVIPPAIHELLLAIGPDYRYRVLDTTNLLRTLKDVQSLYGFCNRSTSKFCSAKQLYCAKGDRLINSPRGDESCHCGAIPPLLSQRRCWPEGERQCQGDRGRLAPQSGSNPSCIFA